VFSPSASRKTCARDLCEHGIKAHAVETPTRAVSNADIVVTATTSHEPVFPAEALADGTLVVAVGAYTAETKELAAAVFDRASQVVADVPEEVAAIGDLAATELGPPDLIPLSAVLEGDIGRQSESEILVVESVGTAVLDAAVAAHIYDQAVAKGLGTEVPL
jgi:alanine dehydrogenase